MQCVFCDIVAGRVPAALIWSDDAFVAFLDANPIAPGHLLLIPRTHVSSVFDLTHAHYIALFEHARALERAVRTVAGASRTAIAVEGFGVEHAHVHLVPVNRAGDLDPCRQRPAPLDERRKMALLLRAAIDVQPI